MSNECCPDSHAANRRGFLKASSVAVALGFTGGLFARAARADALTKAQRDLLTPEQIIELMKEGNARFQRGERKNRDYLREQRASAKGQYPAAVLLSCIDSRAPERTETSKGLSESPNRRPMIFSILARPAMTSDASPFGYCW